MRILINIGLSILFLMLVAAVVAFLRGGEPFKLLGETIVSIGNTLINVGDGVDDFLRR
ncbi:MAG: hypothetical protein HY809_07610 [Nitrospirae bacterium]|nr:hypothetical protein [Nitrospirota bacterium]